MCSLFHRDMQVTKRHETMVPFDFDFDHERGERKRKESDHDDIV